MTAISTHAPTEVHESLQKRTLFEEGEIYEINGVRLWCHDTGGPGEAVVLLGGFTAGHFVFDFIRQHLSDYRIITWEPRGLGPSAAPNPLDSEYSAKVWADDLSGLLSAIGVEKAHFWADGFGGFIALRMAAEHPETVQSLITSTEVWSGLQDRTKNWNVYSAIVNNLGTTGRGAKLLAKWMDIESLPWFVSWEAANISEVLRLETVRATVGYGLLDADVRAELPRIQAPTLLLLGAESAQDALNQAGVSELRAGIENLEISVIEKAHESYGVVTHPREFALAARAFMEANASATRG
jgi:pimeloyl-ACP methyl ester carboxylesterase